MPGRRASAVGGLVPDVGQQQQQQEEPAWAKKIVQTLEQMMQGLNVVTRAQQHVNATADRTQEQQVRRAHQDTVDVRTGPELPGGTKQVSGTIHTTSTVPAGRKERQPGGQSAGDVSNVTQIRSREEREEARDQITEGREAIGVQAQVDQVQVHVGDVDGGLRQVLERFKGTEASLHEILHRFDAMQGQQQQTHARLDGVEDTVVHAVQRLDSMQDNFKAAVGGLDSISRHLGDLENRIEGRFESVSTQWSDLSQRFGVLENSVKRLDSGMRQLETELSNVKSGMSMQEVCRQFFGVEVCSSPMFMCFYVHVCCHSLGGATCAVNYGYAMVVSTVVVGTRARCCVSV
jgi:hypothetical protein